MEAMQSKWKDMASTSGKVPAAGGSSHCPKKIKLGKEKENTNESVHPSTTNTIADWKKSIVDLERKRFEAEDRKRQLECYNLALQNINLERQLGTLFLGAHYFSHHFEEIPSFQN